MTLTKNVILQELEDFKKGACNPYLSGYRAPSGSNEIDLSSKDFKGFVSDSWVIGGMTGGDCWGSEADQAVTASEPEELTLLEEFLEQKMPKLSFLDYKKLRKLIKSEEWGRGEYYGNYYKYKCYYITFEDIANCLSETED
jgi:hypothetical protein